MADAPIAASQRTAGGQVREALDRLEGLVVEGLKHGFFDYSIPCEVREALDRLEGLVVEGLKDGFFDYSIACEVGNGGKRHLVIRAGKSHKFTIPADEVPH